jgi:hypothetical protein
VGLPGPLAIFSLGWQNGNNNFMTDVTGNIPVGIYDAARLANLGICFGAIAASGGIHSQGDRLRQRRRQSRRLL